MTSYDITLKFKNRTYVEKDISLGKVVFLLCKNDKRIDKQAMMSQMLLNNMITADNAHLLLPCRNFCADIVFHHNN